MNQKTQPTLPDTHFVKVSWHNLHNIASLLLDTIVFHELS